MRARTTRHRLSEYQRGMGPFWFGVRAGVWVVGWVGCGAPLVFVAPGVSGCVCLVCLWLLVVGVGGCGGLGGGGAGCGWGWGCCGAPLCCGPSRFCLWHVGGVGLRVAAPTSVCYRAWCPSVALSMDAWNQEARSMVPAVLWMAARMEARASLSSWRYT